MGLPYPLQKEFHCIGGNQEGMRENHGWFRMGRNKGIGVSYRFASYSSKLAQKVRKPSSAWVLSQPSSVGRN